MNPCRLRPFDGARSRGYGSGRLALVLPERMSTESGSVQGRAGRAEGCGAGDSE